MPQFSQSSLDKLKTCDQRLQNILLEVIQFQDFIILEGHRNEADQNAAFAAGKSQKKWPDGNHNSFPSKAVDIAPYFADTKGMDWKDLVAFGRLMGMVQAIARQKGINVRFGLDWDGDFHTVGNDPSEHFLDAPHVEVLD
jgi:hypothetical protein